MKPKTSRIQIFAYALLLHSTLVLSGSSLAEEYKFAQRDITPIKDLLCDDFAMTETQRLRDYLGTSFGAVDIIEGHCVPNHIYNPRNSWNIEITYKANAPLPQVSTLDHMSLERAGYNSKKECDAALAFESKLFQDNTKLAIFSGYCREPLHSDMAWELQITAFGKPEKSPFATSVMISGKPIQWSNENLIQKVRESFTSKDIPIALINVRNRFSYSTLSIRYYANQVVGLQEESLVSFSNEASCLSSLSNLKSTLSAAGSEFISLYCRADTKSNTASNAVSLSYSNSLPSILIVSSEFETLESCEQNRPAIQDHYQNHLHRDIKGSYCSLNGYTSKYKIVLIEKR